MADTFNTPLGPITVASERPFVAVVKAHEAVKVGSAHLAAGSFAPHARADKLSTLEARLQREGFHRQSDGVWKLWGRCPAPGVPAPVRAECWIVAK